VNRHWTRNAKATRDGVERCCNYTNALCTEKQRTRKQSQLSRCQVLPSVFSVGAFGNCRSSYRVSIHQQISFNNAIVANAFVVVA
jgi:hypothetical protein